MQGSRALRTQVRSTKATADKAASGQAPAPNRDKDMYSCYRVLAHNLRSVSLCFCSSA